MTKKDRQKVVLDLINEFEIDTQEELTAKLNERGIDVTQATVSRDINELNLIKISGMVIDKMNIPQVLGSIAGDDTLLIVTKSNADADIMIKKLKEMMG